MAKGGTEQKTYVPCYPMIRPRGCPSGRPRHPVNRANPDQCGLSRLMRDIGASEGGAGLISGWTRKSFTREELEEYNFTVEEGSRPEATCKKCGLVMDLRRERK